MAVRDWIGRWFGDHEQAPAAPSWSPGPGRPRPLTVLYWALTIWTGFCAIALLFSQGGVAKTLAGGLGDAAGDHLLGAQFLLLAIVYGAIARRPGWLDWFPLLAQWLLVAVLIYDWLGGRRTFGATALALLVTLAFALLLAAFRLAGETTIQTRRAAPAGSPNAFNAALHDDRPTERLVRTATPVSEERATEGTQPPRPPEENPDDRVLGA
jgi:hypothetical protein